MDKFDIYRLMNPYKVHQIAINAIKDYGQTERCEHYYSRNGNTRDLHGHLGDNYKIFWNYAKNMDCCSECIFKLDSDIEEYATRIATNELDKQKVELDKQKVTALKEISLSLKHIIAAIDKADLSTMVFSKNDKII